MQDTKITIDYIKQRIEHSTKRYDKKILDLKSKRENLSKAGEWSLGYYEGYISALDNILAYLDKLD